MATRPITVLGEAVLHQKARRVPQVDGSIKRLVEDMIETMRENSGVGLAAPQVGVSLRVVIIGIPGEEVITLINPEIVKRSGERRVVEGCLSVPGYWAEVTRSVSVTAKGRDLEGRQVRIKAKDDLLAQALEHEIDHVNGVLYIDHLESMDELRKTATDTEEEGAAEL